MLEFFDKLTNAIKKYDNIILMTHGTPDLDGMGSAIVFSEILKKMNKKSVIVAPKNLINKSLNKTINYLNEKNVVIPFKYEKSISTTDSLLIVFDVNNSDFVEDKTLLEKVDNKIVIDHHSKSINKISGNVGEYIDEDKSSVVEINTEYLRYLNIKLDSEFYTVLLAGLFNDTYNFNFQTTSLTFNVASYLLENGADLKQTHDFFREPLEVMVDRYNYISNNLKLKDNVYLCVIDDKTCSNITVAKLADEMLRFQNVDLSLAIGSGENGKIFVSARSNGDIDVSKLMQKIGGGGRKSLAATVLENVSIKETIELLKNVIRGE